MISSESDGVASDPLMMYKVQVITGDRRGAGTDANVTLTVYGELNGEKSKQWRNRNLTTDKITLKERKQMFLDLKFQILEISRKSELGHDDSGFGSGKQSHSLFLNNNWTDPGTSSLL